MSEKRPTDSDESIIRFIEEIATTEDWGESDYAIEAVRRWKDCRAKLAEAERRVKAVEALAVQLETPCACGMLHDNHFLAKRIREALADGKGGT